MKITKKGFPSIMRDNDMKYLNYIFNTIEKIDKDCEVNINKNNSGCAIRVIPSNKIYKEELLEKLIISHNMIGIDIEFSNTIMYSDNINWIINK